MRIISGTAGGRKLISPPGLDIRPTTDKVKEAMFSIVQFDLPDRNVLDLFSGTGQLGLEALSRGARQTVFVDRSKRSLELTEKNIRLAGFSERSSVVHSDAVSFLKRSSRIFDIALLDPPYDMGLCAEALEHLPSVMKSGGVIVCETREDEALPESAEQFYRYREYRYSNIKLTVYREN